MHFSGYCSSTLLVSWELSCDVSAPPAISCPGLPALTAGIAQPHCTGLVPDSAADGPAPLQLEEHGLSWEHPILGVFLPLFSSYQGRASPGTACWILCGREERQCRQGEDLPLGAGFPGTRGTTVWGWEHLPWLQDVPFSTHMCSSHLSKPLLGRSALFWENFSF